MRWWEPLAVVPVVACLGWLIVLFALGFLHVRNRVPWMRPEDHAHMLEGLRKAGWQG
jgi:hypothetical protein